MICRRLIETLNDLRRDVNRLIEIEDHRGVFVTFQHQIIAFAFANLLHDLPDNQQESLGLPDFSLTELLCGILSKAVGIVYEAF